MGLYEWQLELVRARSSDVAVVQIHVSGLEGYKYAASF